MAGIAHRTFWSKGYALMQSATRTIDMTLPSFIHSFIHANDSIEHNYWLSQKAQQVLLLNSFPCLFLYSYLCKLLFYVTRFTLGLTLKGGGGMVKTNTSK